MSAPIETTTVPATNGAAPEVTNGIVTEPTAATQTGTTKTTPAETTTAATPAKGTAAKSPIDEKDVNHWKNRANELVSTSGKSEAAIVDAKPWHESLFACFTPIDTCAITCCVPCVTFGKTHHRLHHHGELEGYSMVNTSCLLFCVSSCLAWLPATLQRGDIRKKYGLQGSFVTDLAISCCCHCCNLVQMDKEAAWQEKELLSKVEQYEGGETMEYKAPVEEA